MTRIKYSSVMGRKVRISAIALALMSTSAIVAISGGASSGAATKTVTLKFLNAYNDVTETPVMNGVVIPAFESENPGIKVVDETVPYDGMLDKFIAGAAAGNPPSLMRSDIAWVPQLAADGILLKTSAQPWWPKVKKEADPGPLSTNLYKGAYYGLPDDTNTQVLFYNKADFAAANLTPPTTWDEMISDAKALTISGKQWGLGVDSTDIWNVGPFVWTDGGNFTNSKWTTASGFMNSSATESAVQQLVTLEQTGVIGTDMAGGSGAISGETGFPTGEYAMYMDGPWATTTYKDANFTGYGTELIPAGPGGSVSVVGGEDLVIPKNAKNRADVIKFVKFLQSPFAQLAMAGAGDMTPYKNLAADETTENPALGIFAKALLTARARPVNSGYTTLDTDFSDQLAMVLAGNETVTQALATATTDANAALKSGQVTLVKADESNPALPAQGSTRRRSALGRRVRSFGIPYLLIAPAVLIYAVFTVYPIFRQFDISFYDWHIFPGANNPFLGWGNYTAIFHDPVVRTAALTRFSLLSSPFPFRWRWVFLPPPT